MVMMDGAPRGSGVQGPLPLMVCVPKRIHDLLFGQKSAPSSYRGDWLSLRRKTGRCRHPPPKAVPSARYIPYRCKVLFIWQRNWREHDRTKEEFGEK